MLMHKSTSYLVIGLFVLFMLGSFVWLRARVKRKECEIQIRRIGLVWNANESVRRQRQALRVEEELPLLTGNTWQDSVGKRAFALCLYKDKVPKFLFFAVPHVEQLEEKDVMALAATFWTDGYPRHGDIELRRRENPEGGMLLRIRDPQLFASEIFLQGAVCPLWQIGHEDDVYGPIVTFSRLAHFNHKAA